MTDRPRSAGSRASVLDALDRVTEGRDRMGVKLCTDADAATLRELRDALAGLGEHDLRCSQHRTKAGYCNVARWPTDHGVCPGCALAALLSAGAEGEP